MTSMIISDHVKRNFIVYVLNHIISMIFNLSFSSFNTAICKITMRKPSRLNSLN